MGKIRKWLRRNLSSLIRLGLLLIGTWLLTDAAVRQLLKTEGLNKLFLGLNVFQFFGGISFYALLLFHWSLDILLMQRLGKVRAEVPNLTLADFKGYPELRERAKVWLREMKQGYARSIIIAGPPGAGKRHFVRCIAGEAGVPCFEIDCEQVAILGGPGMLKIQGVFSKAASYARKYGAVLVLRNIEATTLPSLLPDIRATSGAYYAILDELDKLATRRGRIGRLVNFFLGLVGKSLPPLKQRLMVFGLSEQPDALMGMLFQRGRFGETVELSSPTLEGREELIAYALAQVPHTAIVEAQIRPMAAWKTAYDIIKLITVDAPRMAALAGRRTITFEDIRAAHFEQLFGGRLALPLREEEKKGIAYHEAGHAYTAWLMEKRGETTDWLVEGISIIPRTGWGAWMPHFGVTFLWSEVPDILLSHKRLWTDIQISYGGQIAEELAFGSSTIGTGADNRHIQTRVMQLYRTGAFSRYIRQPKFELLGGLTTDIPKELEPKIEQALEKHYAQLKAWMFEDWHKVEALVEALLEKQELTCEEIHKILEGAEK